MDFSEKWGTTVEEAVSLALADLNLSQDEVDIKVIEEPSKGFFGIGSKLALVRVEKKKPGSDKAYSSLEQEIKKEVTKSNNGVNINFKGFVTKDKIESMVNNCKSGKCDCMSDETKQKITDMQVSGNDGDVKLTLSGDINEDEIKKALDKSKVIN